MQKLCGASAVPKKKDNNKNRQNCSDECMWATFDHSLSDQEKWLKEKYPLAGLSLIASMDSTSSGSAVLGDCFSSACPLQCSNQFWVGQPYPNNLPPTSVILVFATLLPCSLIEIFVFRS